MNEAYSTHRRNEKSSLEKLKGREHSVDLGVGQWYDCHVLHIVTLNVAPECISRQRIYFLIKELTTDFYLALTLRMLGTVPSFP
jgi:hypothetical protein